MNAGELYFNDKHPIWCWDKFELFGIVKKLPYVKLKESLTMFMKIIEVTDNYLVKMDTPEGHAVIDSKDDHAKEMAEKFFGEKVIEMVTDEHRRGVSRNKRAKEMANILAIEISLWEVWNESQNDSDKGSN